MAWELLAAIFLGWSLGSNDAANVFGTAVASRMLRYVTAASICSIFVVLGAWLDGYAGIETYSKFSDLTLKTAFIVSISAAISVTGMNLLKLQVSTSQAIVGALTAIGLHQGEIKFKILFKILLCWITTPLGSAIIAVILFFALGKILNKLYLSIFAYDQVLRIALLLSGIYGAYALGANAVANVTGPFVGSHEGMLSPKTAALIGGIAIALGILTNGYRVIKTIGHRIIKLNAFTALIAVLAEATTVYFYAWIGVPVSASQALVGALIGLGSLRGAKSIRLSTVGKLIWAWLFSPLISFSISYILYKIL